MASILVACPPVPLVLLFFLFIVLPLAELYVIVQLAGVIGIWWTIGLLLADSIAGTLLMKSQGRTAWRRFNEATAEGRIPGREVADGALIILGGAFLLTPGFITDVIGFLLLIPPTRAIFRRTVVGLFARRNPVAFVGMKAAPHAERAWRERRERRNGADGDYVEGTATEHPGDGDDETPPPPRERLEP
jgi:UPF0716 protein FxsA